MYELWNFDFGTGFGTKFAVKQAFFAVNIPISIRVPKITVFQTDF